MQHWLQKLILNQKQCRLTGRQAELILERMLSSFLAVRDFNLECDTEGGRTTCCSLGPSIINVQHFGKWGLKYAYY